MKKLIIRVLAQAIVALVIIISSAFVGYGVYLFTKGITTSGIKLGSEQAPVFDSKKPTIQPGETASVKPANPSIPEVEPEMTPWDGASRVTVLLLGLDYRDWEAGNDYSRSDTMIILTMDPLTRTAGMLSIPRDMWAPIPGFKHGKINTAYYLGDAYKLPGGGPGLAVKTVEQFLGVPINYYAQIDFSAFVGFINEIGGVKINVPEAITVDLLGSGAATKKTLQPGIQVLPGEWALAYARARYTSEGDFDRARRQQQVIMAIRDRILSLDMLSILIQKADILYAQLASGIHTNLSLQQVIQLALLASRVRDENIRKGVIGKEYVYFGQSPDNLSILIPIPDKIHALRDELFTTGGAWGPQTPGTVQEKMILEGARVVVLNGSHSDGLETRTSDYLRSQGVNIVSVGRSEQLASQTSLTNLTGKPFVAAYLVELMNISPFKIMYDYQNNSESDILVVLGDDWARLFSNFNNP